MTDQTEIIVPGQNTKSLLMAYLQSDPRIKSYHSRRGYLADLAAFEEWRGNRPYSKMLVESYAAELQAEGKAPKTINRKLAAIRWWSRKIADIVQEQIPTTPEERAHQAAQVAQAERVASVSDVRGIRGMTGRHVPTGEFRALIAACEADKSLAGLRDATLINFAWSTGARRAEIARVCQADITLGDKPSVTLYGKGDKVRTGYFTDAALESMLDWIDQLAGHGITAGAVFCEVTKGGKLQPPAGGMLSGEAMRKILDKRKEQAKISKPLTWHDFRRTFAGSLLDAGVDLVTVQKLMGHSSPATTGAYDRRTEEVRRSAIKNLFGYYDSSRWKR